MRNKEVVRKFYCGQKNISVGKPAVYEKKGKFFTQNPDNILFSGRVVGKYYFPSGKRNPYIERR